FGTSRVAVEILRPDGANNFVTVGRKETRIDWQAPHLNVSIDAPKVAQLNQDVPVTFTVASTGSIEARPIMLELKIRAGVGVVNRAGTDKLTRDGDAALWQVPPLPAGSQHAVQAVLRPTRTGSVNLTALVPTEDGQRVEESATVQVTEAKLQMSLSGP